jgi:hypothetical protein
MEVSKCTKKNVTFSLVLNFFATRTDITVANIAQEMDMANPMYPVSLSPMPSSSKFVVIIPYKI